VESVGEVYSIFSDCTDYDLFIYNESLIRYFRPNLAKGVWFSDYTPSKSGVTPIVVAADSIYELGDSFPLELYYLVEGDRLTMHTEAFVIGVIAAPVQYATLSKGADEIYFQSDFLFNQSSEVIILPNTREIDNFLGDRKYELASMGKLLYLREDVDVSIVKGDFGYYGVVSDLSKGKSQFYHSVYMGLLREALYFSTYFLITVSCIMCINLIQNKDNKRRFTIYYLLGMDAKRGVMIETVRLFLMTALSVGATILFLLTQPFLLNEFTPSQRPFAILALLVYLAIVFLPISIVFVINTARHNIVDTLKDLFWDR
jgi:hypothetical protein